MSDGEMLKCVCWGRGLPGGESIFIRSPVEDTQVKKASDEGTQEGSIRSVLPSPHLGLNRIDRNSKHECPVQAPATRHISLRTTASLHCQLGTLYAPSPDTRAVTCPTRILFRPQPSSTQTPLLVSLSLGSNRNAHSALLCPLSQSGLHASPGIHRGATSGQ